MSENLIGTDALSEIACHEEGWIGTRDAWAGRALVVGACCSAADVHAADPPTGSLRVGVGQGLVNPDPHTCTLYSDVRILEQVYEGLLRIDPASLKPVPALAESYDLAPDQLSWTFHLRHGVTFAGGAALTSADVKYSIDRIRDPKTGATLRSDYDSVAEVLAPDSSSALALSPRTRAGAGC